MSEPTYEEMLAKLPSEALNMAYGKGYMRGRGDVNKERDWLGGYGFAVMFLIVYLGGFATCFIADRVVLADQRAAITAKETP